MSTERLLQRWLRIEAEAKARLYAQGYEDARLLNANYWLGILFSAGIATLGLVLNSPAVIIGAMLISPLMAPIMAAGMGFAAGDLYLTGKAVFKLLMSILVAMALSAALVWLLPFHSETPEILSRTNPTLLDLGVALFSGLAGSVAVSRYGNSEGVTTVPGVAIAVALMPPLCTMGFAVGTGFQRDILRGSGLLFLTNIVAIVFSAFLIFLFVGINCPEVWAEMRRCQAAEPLAKSFARGPISAAITNGGQLRWRATSLVVLLAAVAWPLSVSLRQLTGEAHTREIVDQSMRPFLPSSEVVSQQTVVGQHSVAIHVVATAQVAPERVRRLEQEIAKRSGREVSVTVQAVASQSELAKLVDRLNTSLATVAVQPASPPPPPVPVAVQATDVVDRVGPVLTSVWPPQAKMKDFDLVLSEQNPVLQVHYTAEKQMTPISLGLISQMLQDKLTMPTLTLNATWIPVHPRHKRQGRRRVR